MNINWDENSTKRGAVWLVYGLLSIFFLVMDRKEDIAILTTVAGVVAGGMGLTSSDTVKKDEPPQ